MREVAGGSDSWGRGVSEREAGARAGRREAEAGRGADRVASWAVETAGRAGPRGIGPRMGFAGPSGEERGVRA